MWKENCGKWLNIACIEWHPKYVHSYSKQNALLMQLVWDDRPRIYNYIKPKLIIGFNTHFWHNFNKIILCHWNIMCNLCLTMIWRWYIHRNMYNIIFPMFLMLTTRASQTMCRIYFETFQNHQLTNIMFKVISWKYKKWRWLTNVNTYNMVCFAGCVLNLVVYRRMRLMWHRDGDWQYATLCVAGIC